MELSSALASKNYQNVLSAVKPISGISSQSDDGPSFAKVASDLIGTLQKGEAIATDGITGKADAHSVVKALAQTELAIETAVTVRDKVVEAYQEILRMPV